MTERLRLYLDEDAISRSLIRGLRARGVDLLSAQEAGRIALSDRAQLEFATAGNHCIVTHNTRDFAALHSDFMRAGLSHAGIIVSDQLQIGLIMRRLLRLLDAVDAEEMRNRLEFLSNWR